ncbi:MAG: glycine zipper 2TM domain-containing protein [Rhodocyclaceae bacterium]|nr:glycine zipper 2TM domain-containing protein [Rhodocyclaceae bacterium]
MHNHVLPVRLHPAVLAAALSVTAFSFVGIGAMTGVIRGPWKAEPAAVAAPTPVAAIPAPVATAPSPAQVQTVPIVIRPVVTAPAPAAAKTYSTREPSRDANLRRVADREANAGDDLPIEVIRRAPADDRPPPAAYGTQPPATAPANLPVAAPVPPAVAPAPVCRECGTVENVREVKTDGEGSGIGAVAGGVLGGILGTQVGNGRGRNLATLAGIVGGAYAGNRIEKSQRTTVRYEATVRFDDGSTRSFTQDMPWSWRAGDRVRLSNGTLAAGA